MLDGIIINLRLHNVANSRGRVGLRIPGHGVLPVLDYLSLDHGLLLLLLLLAKSDAYKTKLITDNNNLI